MPKNPPKICLNTVLIPNLAKVIKEFLKLVWICRLALESSVLPQVQRTLKFVQVGWWVAEVFILESCFVFSVSSQKMLLCSTWGAVLCVASWALLLVKGQLLHLRVSTSSKLQTGVVALCSGTTDLLDASGKLKRKGSACVWLVFLRSAWQLAEMREVKEYPGVSLERACWAEWRKPELKQLNVSRLQTEPINTVFQWSRVLWLYSALGDFVQSAVGRLNRFCLLKQILHVETNPMDSNLSEECPAY